MNRSILSSVVLTLLLSGCGATMGQAGRHFSLARDGSVLVGTRGELRLSLEEPEEADKAPRAEKRQIYDQKKGGNSGLDQTIGFCGVWKF